jgi:glycosyltransferase involved in cell wall biosynthesis/SAM-dependent methyltransferase
VTEPMFEATERNRTVRAQAGMTVAVVIPTYNHAQFLGEALESVLAQSRPADEIIVVDDGSNDDPEAIVRRFPGVKYVRRENGGLSAARNTGLSSSTADKIVFLDADDLLHPGAVEAGLATFELTPEAAFVYGAHRRIDKQGNVLVPYRYTAIGPSPYLDFLRCNMIGMHATVMYDRLRLSLLGGFDTRLRRCEDYDVYLRLSLEGRVASHAGLVADYRWHGGNMSADNGEMLAWVLKVHAQHKAAAEARPETLEAWKSGRKIWREYYADDTLNSLRGKPTPELLSGLASAMKASPAVTLRRSARGLKQRLVEKARTLAARWPPPIGSVDFGDLGSTRPVSRDFGFDRGTPIDRYYIEQFLTRHAEDIRGRVLEIGDASYSKRFGGQAITQQDVLHVSREVPEATLIGDMAEPGVLPEGAFDCMVLTQTLHLIYDMRAALKQAYRALKPGGVILLTVPGITQLDRGEWNHTWSWSLTPYSARRLFEELFLPSDLQIVSSGNVFAATAFLQGVALEEVEQKQLDEMDLAYPVIVSVRARRSAG